MEEVELDLINQTAKLSYQDFQTYLESLNDEMDQVELLKARCASDLELFAELFFPHYCTRAFNPYHRYFFARTQFGERNYRRADAAPRGSAKSTLTTLIKPIHDVCYGLERFILILSSTTPLANKKLKDIRTEIQSNSLLIDTFGVKFSKKKVGESEFTVFSEQGSTFFAALGSGAEVRGIRVGPVRPTKVIADDVEHSDEVYNEQVRKKTEAWWTEDIGKVGDTGTNIEIVGTVLHDDSLLSKLLKNPAYTGKTFKAILSWSEREDLWNNWREIYRNLDNPNRLTDSQAFYESNETEMLKGTDVMWPEKEDYLAHMKDMEEIGRRAFMKEKQNEPQGAEDAVFTQFHWYTEVETGLKLENGKIVEWKNLVPFAALDPSTGQEKTKNKRSPDFSCMIVAYKDILTQRVFVHWDWTKIVPPTKFISAIFESWNKYKFEKMALETNLYRNLLLPNIIEEQKRILKETKVKPQVTFYDVENTENKRERIYRLEPKVTHGHIVFNRALSRPFMDMFRAFPNPDAHDDAPDCLELVWNLINNRYKPSELNVDALFSV